MLHTYNSHNSGGRGTSLLLSAIVLVLMSLAAQSAPALECGEEITGNVKLTADLGPCPGIGLNILDHAGATNITVNLNGHSILGSGAGAGLNLFTHDVTIKGPGSIVNFGTGIQISSTLRVMIYDLTLLDNISGVKIKNSGWINVFDNSIRGGTRGVTGMNPDDAGNIFFYRNTISGHSGAGVDVGVSDPVISENVISQNGVGIVALGLGAPAVLGNRISNNQTDGIRLGGIEACGSIEDNDINSNGGNGILLSGMSHNCLARNNRIRNNHAVGISLSKIDDPERLHRITGNRLSGNSTDLFWNGAAGACWRQNIYRTSVPATLPQCTGF